MRNLTDFEPCQERAKRGVELLNCELLVSFNALAAEIENKSIQQAGQNAAARMKKRLQSRFQDAYSHAVHSATLEQLECGDEQHLERLFEAFEMAEIDGSFVVWSIIDNPPILSKASLLKSIYEIDDTFEFQLGSCDSIKLEMASEAIEIARLRLLEFMPELAAEVAVYINEIVVAMPTSGHEFTSGSSFFALGAMSLSCEAENIEWVDVVDSIIHEAAHHHLFVLSRQDDLVLNDVDDRFSAPLRDDPRTMMGIYHACFVLARLVYFFEAASRTPLPKHEISKIETKAVRYRNRFNSSLNTILRHGDLTAAGRKVMLNAQAALRTSRLY